MKKQFVATYGESVQVGTDEYKYIRTSKIVTEETNVYDLLEWLRSLGCREPSLALIDFSDLID